MLEVEILDNEPDHESEEFNFSIPEDVLISVVGEPLADGWETDDNMTFEYKSVRPAKPEEIALA